jgi:hypothetical protein
MNGAPSNNKFDRAIGALDGLPDVIKTAPTTIRAVTPIVGDPQTFIVQTFRQRDGEKISDTLFIEYVDGEVATRLVIPSAVTRVIARQREALAARTRKRAARAGYETRVSKGTQTTLKPSKRKAVRS